MARMNRLFPREYNYAPKTWNLPSDWAEFKVVSNSSKNSTFIAKPDHGCQGKGIFLFKGMKDLISRYNEYLSAPPLGSTTSLNNSSISAAGTAAARRQLLLSENSIPSNMVIQQYLSRPYLIDGYKFDLRVYALVTNVDPLRIFVYEDGLARFATEKYEPPSSVNLNDVFMHLTNYAINKVKYLFWAKGPSRFIPSFLPILPLVKAFGKI